MKVKEIMQGDSSMVGHEVVVKGWVRTIRNQKTFAFIEINDGSAPKGIQVSWTLSETSDCTHPVRMGHEFAVVKHFAGKS